MPTTITLPQLRDALRRLEANVSAEELWCALRQQELNPAPGNWPAARDIQPLDPLTHYRAMADEAIRMAASGQA